MRFIFVLKKAWTRSIDLWTGTRSGAPWTEAVVWRMGWRQLTEGQWTGHCSSLAVAVRSEAERGRQGGVDGALGGDGVVA
jgi:hypothetical protein